MFGVNLETTSNDVIVDEELNEILSKLKVDYNQFYRGIVVDNIDPEIKGRVKVRIPQIYGTDPKSDTFVPTNSIPWALCAINPAGNDSGTFLPPNIGDTVFVAFESGLSISPIYFGGIFTTRKEDDTENKGVGSAKVFDNKIAPVVTDDLPLEITEGTERIIYKSLKGAIIYIDDRDGGECIKITDQSGQSIIMENLSNETLRRRGNYLGKNPKSQIVLTNSCGDSITLTHGKIHLKSANIILETDNFIQKGITSPLDDEDITADIILGDESDECNLTLDVRNIKNNEPIQTSALVDVYKIEDGQEIYIGRYGSFISQIMITLPFAEYKFIVKVQDESYYDGTFNLTVDEFEHTEIMYLTPVSDVDEIQFVLTWNNVIPDIDSHTKIYDLNNNLLGHVSYQQMNYIENDRILVNLDIDDTDGYGPETTTVDRFDVNKKYLFYIHRYTSEIVWLHTDAKVTVYYQGRILDEIEFNPSPDISLDIVYWNVFEYIPSTNTINIINTYGSEEPSL